MTQSAAPKDRREYVRISVDMPLNPKLASLDNPAAGWLAVCAIAYCGQNLTDGLFIPGVVYRLAGVDPAVGKDLIDVGLWHEPGHDCPTCPQPGDRQLIVHDYLEHQRSRDEAQALRSSRSDAGSKGAQKRWAGKRASEAAAQQKHREAIETAHGEALAMTLAMPSAIAKGWQDDGKAIAEVEGEVDKELNPSVTPDGATPHSPSKKLPKTKPGDSDQLFDESPRSEPAGSAPTQLLVAAYCEAVTAAGGIPTSGMTGAIGRNVKTLLEKDHLEPAVLLLAVQRAGAARARNLDRYLGAVQTTFDRAGQSRRAMFAAWDEWAAHAENPQRQIGA